MKRKSFWECLTLASVLLLVVFVYLKTSNPIFTNDDSPETAAAAYTLGISHPPGYPLFSMAAKIVTLIPLASPAFRVNIFSVLLSLLVLITAYFTCRDHLINMFIKEGFWAKRILSFAAVLILAFSYIFWNQGTGAKGGIYVLNLLLISVILLCCMKILEKPELKYFYLASFLFSLGLANHWMSIIIAGPVILFLYILHRDNLGIKGFIISALFLLIGLSAYVYLPIRAGAGPDLNIGNPVTVRDFLWVVLRNLYQYPAKTEVSVYIHQVTVFLKFFFTNYSLFVIFSFIGFWVTLKLDRKKTWLLMSVFILYVIVIVPYTRTIKGNFILENILLMPAEYVCLLFISAGIAWTYSSLGKNIYKYAFSVVFAALFCFMGFKHYELNNLSRDFITYDFGKAILNTMEKDSAYFGEGDEHLMPVYYLKEINRERDDVRLFSSMFLTYRWGIDSLLRKYGLISLQPGSLGSNLVNSVERFIKIADVYRSSLYPKFDEIALPYKQYQKGLLIKICPGNELVSPGIFDVYSYRGIFSRFCRLDGHKQDLIAWYAKGMVNQANDLNNAGKIEDALRLYKRALIFPVIKPEPDIYYSMSIAYSRIGDADNELDCLEKTLLKDGKYVLALEKAGVIYYERDILPAAKDMFGRAVEAGSNSEYIKNTYNKLNQYTYMELCEYSLNKAVGYLAKKDIKKAMYIFNFLLDKNYKAGIIQNMIGTYYFNLGGYSEALNWFLKPGVSAQSPEVIYCKAYSYYKLKDLKAAIKELEDGIKLYNNSSLNNLYLQLKKTQPVTPE